MQVNHFYFKHKDNVVEIVLSQDTGYFSTNKKSTYFILYGVYLYKDTNNIINNNAKKLSHNVYMISEETFSNNYLAFYDDFYVSLHYDFFNIDKNNIHKDITTPILAIVTKRYYSTNLVEIHRLIGEDFNLFLKTGNLETFFKNVYKHKFSIQLALDGFFSNGQEFTSVFELDIETCILVFRHNSYKQFVLGKNMKLDLSCISSGLDYVKFTDSIGTSICYEYNTKMNELFVYGQPLVDEDCLCNIVTKGNVNNCKFVLFTTDLTNLVFQDFPFVVGLYYKDEKYNSSLLLAEREEKQQIKGVYLTGKEAYNKNYKLNGNNKLLEKIQRDYAKLILLKKEEAQFKKVALFYDYSLNCIDFDFVEYFD